LYIFDDLTYKIHAWILEGYKKDTRKSLPSYVVYRHFPANSAKTAADLFFDKLGIRFVMPPGNPTGAMRRFEKTSKAQIPLTQCHAAYLRLLEKHPCTYA